jgi:hypothetical protein
MLRDTTASNFTPSPAISSFGLRFARIRAANDL